MSAVRRLFTIILGIALVALCGCVAGETTSSKVSPSTDDGPVVSMPPPSQSPAISVQPTTSPIRHQTPAERCVGTGYDVPLVVAAETVDEIETLADIDACTSVQGTDVYLVNRSDLVWRIFADRPAGTVPVAHSPRRPVDTIMAQVVRGAAIMEPGSWVVARGVRPDELHWYADPVLTGVYTNAVELQKTAIDSAIEHSPDVLSEGSRARAHLVCAVAGYQLGSGAYETTHAKSTDERVQAVAEAIESVVTGAGDCRTALQQADQEQLDRAVLDRGVVRQIESTPRAVRVKALEVPVRSSVVVARRLVITGVKALR